MVHDSKSLMLIVHNIFEYILQFHNTTELYWNYVLHDLLIDWYYLKSYDNYGFC